MCNMVVIYIRYNNKMFNAFDFPENTILRDISDAHGILSIAQSTALFAVNEILPEALAPPIYNAIEGATNIPVGAAYNVSMIPDILVSRTLSIIENPSSPHPPQTYISMPFANMLDSILYENPNVHHDPVIEPQADLPDKPQNDTLSRA